MKGLIVDAMTAVGVCAAALAVGVIVWDKATAIPASLEVELPEGDTDGDEEDDTAAWDRGHDEWIDRQTGVSW